MNESRFTVFLRQLQTDLKGFAWFNVLFFLFRVAFILLFGSRLAQGLFSADTFTSLWLGLRMSLKTSGFIMLIGAVLSTVPKLFFPGWKADSKRYYWYALCNFLFTLLFFGRIPYYRIFNSGYNLMLINGKNDDIYAIFMTAIQEYGLLWRLPLALILAACLCVVLKKWLGTPTHTFVTHSRKETLGKSVLILAGITVFWVFVRFGGAFGYTHSVNWENVSRLRSNLLNEAVLDDGQALYRVHSMHKRMKKSREVTFTEEELRQMIATTGGNPDGATIDEAYRRTITEEKMQTQPRHIVMVLGESYAQWPFLPQFDSVGIYLTEKGRKFAASPRSMQTQYMLSHGSGTMPAVNGFVSGLPDTGIYLNYEKASYEETYGTGIGAVMKQLGYKTVFWYGGFGTWQNVGPFVRSQHFDEFRDATSFAGDKGGNAWGVPDKILFDNAANYIKQHKNEKIFHLILTTSNHPPYTIDLKAAGFDSDRVKENLPDTIPDDPNTLNELGHFWYADHVMGEFIEETEKEIPESLFVITGDHGERFSFAKEMDLQSISSIPCIFYGKGIDPSWLPEKQFGSALQVAPTLAVLVGRKGDTYSSLVPDLLQKQNFVFNHYLWGDAEGIYEQKMKQEEQDMPDTEQGYFEKVKLLADWFYEEKIKPVTDWFHAATTTPEPGRILIDKDMSDADRDHVVLLRRIAVWRILKGNRIK